MVKGGGYAAWPLVKDEILAFRYREGRKIEARTLRGGTTVEQDQPVTLHGMSNRSSPPSFFLYLSSLFLGFIKPTRVREATHASSMSNNVQQFPVHYERRVESALVVIDFAFLCLSSCIERSTHTRVIADL